MPLTAMVSAKHAVVQSILNILLLSIIKRNECKVVLKGNALYKFT